MSAPFSKDTALRKLIRDAIFALVNVVLAAFVLLLDWPWPLELLLYFGIMLVLRPLIQKRDDTVNRRNITYALVLGVMSYYSVAYTFADSLRPAGPDLQQASGWPLWVLLPGICFLIFNAMTFRIKVYRFWTHPLCAVILTLWGTLAMFELHLLLTAKGFGFNLWAQLLYWAAYIVPMLHDAARRREESLGRPALV
ncbi:hypothetical protein IT575_08850 [bacterium]|nr:hypothetical protein [bacterium]